MHALTIQTTQHFYERLSDFMCISQTHRPFGHTLRTGLRNLEVQIFVPSKRRKISTSEMPAQVNSLQFSVPYMLQSHNWP